MVIIKSILKIMVILIILPLKFVSRTLKPILRADAHSNVTEVVGYFTQAQVQPDTATIKSTLKDMGYPENLLTYPVQGGGGYRVHGRWLIFGGEGLGGGDMRRTGKHDIQVGGGQGFSSVGLRLVNLGFLRAYPFVGIGGSGMGAGFYEADTHNQVLTPDEDKKLVGVDYFGATLNVGMCIEVKIGGRFGVILGLRAGYVFPLKKISPKSGQEGFYSRFFIGATASTPQNSENTG